MGKLLKATHQGELNINELKITCAVLEDGTRVVSERSIANAIGASGSGSYWRKRKKGGAVKPRYLYANFLDPYISDELLLSLSESTPYKAVNGSEALGLRAEVIPEICDVWVKAGQKGAVPNSSKVVSDKAYVLLKGFATVGIIALIDEATGYQFDREKDELQHILKAYISEELLPWQKKFPDIFYKELFRLNGWDFTVNGIKKRPGVIGKWTKTLIYNELPNGVLKELEKNTPKDEKGHKKTQMHRLLTDDIGNPHLKAQINQMIILFQLSDDMKHMWNQFEKLKMRQSGQLELPFNFDEKGHTIEPVEETTLSNFNKNLKKGLEYNPKKNK